MNVTTTNPTESVGIDFRAFLANRQLVRTSHTRCGVPDYSFGLDAQLRAGITSVPALRTLAQMIVSSHEPLMQQMNLINGIAVGPDQLPEIFRIAERCAERLGIGVPRVFVLTDHIANAWTYASDDARPSIVITTHLLRGLDESELTAIIGHECGHIHNLHSAYNTLVELTANTAAKRVLMAASTAGAPIGLLIAAASLVGQGLKLAMLRWSRAAEITCDRAGAICAGGVRPMMSALAKLKTGGEEVLAGIDIDAYCRQLEQIGSTPLKLVELLQTHPMTQKRIAALRFFEDSEVFRAWLPAVEPSKPARSREEVERLCVDIVRVIGHG